MIEHFRAAVTPGTNRRVCNTCFGIVASLRSHAVACLGLVWVLGWSGLSSLACDSSFVGAPPPHICTEVGVQCTLEKGPLGVCEQIPCANGLTGPCLVCTPQH